jgi:hypothetical protein
MSVRLLNRKARVICLCLVWIMPLLALPTGAAPRGQFLIGAYGGSSFGLGDDFHWHSGGSYSEGHYPIFHLGVYGQYDLSERFGLQLNANFQAVSLRSYFHYYYGYPEYETEARHFLSLSLNGIHYYLKTKNARFYLLAGAGVGTGNSHENHNSNINFSGGTGIKLYARPGSLSAVNVGATFHHLWRPNPGYDDDHASYFRFNIGYEFAARGPRD